MIKRRGIPGLIGFLKGLGWVKLSIGGVLLLFLILAGGVCALAGGGGADGSPAPGAAPEEEFELLFPEDQPADSGAGPDGGVPPLAADTDAVATQVAEQVAATVEAMAPTATPVPTPDVAATVQAQIAGGQDEAAPVVAVNPLDSGSVRNPHLTVADHEYLASLGEDLWIATQLYLRVSELATASYLDLTVPLLQERLIFIDDLLNHLMELPPRKAATGKVTPVVSSYGGFVEGGIRAVQESVNEFRSILSIFEEAEAGSVDELGPAERERLRQRYLVANENLNEFYSVMTAYGCSICGELFRASFRLE